MATCKTVPMADICAAPQVWLRDGSAELLNIVVYFSISPERGPGCSQLTLVPSCRRKAGRNHPALCFYGARQKLHCSVKKKPKGVRGKKKKKKSKDPPNAAVSRSPPSLTPKKSSPLVSLGTAGQRGQGAPSLPARRGCGTVTSDGSGGRSGDFRWDISVEGPGMSSNHHSQRETGNRAPSPSLGSALGAAARRGPGAFVFAQQGDSSRRVCSVCTGWFFFLLKATEIKHRLGAALAALTVQEPEEQLLAGLCPSLSLWPLQHSPQIKGKYLLYPELC